jgi:hypothetical protein
MPRDIDEISRALKAEYPGCEITQLKVTHPADDDGVWFVSLPDDKNTIQLEAPDGNCPFTISFDQKNRLIEGKTVLDVLSKIRILVGLPSSPA